jgi:dephospho-CoA kinase
MDSLLKSDTPTLKFFGICGGSSCGKSKITKYFQSKIHHSIVVAEKDFLKTFKPSQRKKSFHEEKENLFAVSNTQDAYSQERKQRLIELNDPESYDWDNLNVN